MGVPVYRVDVPHYRIDTEPDHNAVGRLVDAEIKKHFMGCTVIARGISSSAHPGKSRADLVEIIQEKGTDRYDPHRKGDRYENLENKHIDLFAFRRKVTPRMRLFKDVSWGFYHGSIMIHGAPVRIDLLTLYDAAKMKVVLHQYEGREDKKRDGYVFRDPERKVDALLGILHIG
ncbi:MAG TPA: hypothetical protein VI076_16630 [Actinopolymorphaceae bacterium]